MSSSFRHLHFFCIVVFGCKPPSFSLCSLPPLPSCNTLGGGPPHLLANPFRTFVGPTCSWLMNSGFGIQARRPTSFASFCQPKFPSVLPRLPQLCFSRPIAGHRVRRQRCCPATSILLIREYSATLRCHMTHQLSITFIVFTFVMCQAT